MFKALNSRSALGKFYANNILYSKLKKYLNGHVLDYGAGVGILQNFIVM
jgi:2-polyprenyl-3-methyl-5-hydroxy-6-metoxy-1,4-benzoquinol methylase